MKKHSLILFILCCFGPALWGQNLLTLQQAIEIALKNNYSITIAENELAVADNNTAPGNAGMLPTVSLNGSASWASNDTKQEFNNGSTVDKKDASSVNTGAGLALNWTLFDGMKMFATYDKLKTMKDMTETSLRIEVENTVAATTTF